MNRFLSAIIIFGLVLVEGCAPPPEAADTQAPLLSPTLSPTPLPRQAVLSELRNTVLARPGAEAEWRAAAEGQRLEVGGGVETRTEARARVDISDGTLLRLAENTVFQLQELSPLPTDPVTRLVLEAGKVWVSVTKALGIGSFEIETPVGVATVRGSLIGVEYAPVTGQMIVTCLEGVCVLAGAGDVAELRAGQQSEIPGEGQSPTEAHAILAEQLEGWSENFPEAAPVVNEITPAPTETASATATVTMTPAGIVTPTPSPTPSTGLGPAATAPPLGTPARAPTDAPTPTPPAAATSGEYIISGGSPSAGIYVDDVLRVFVNEVLVAEVEQHGRCCSPVSPIRFTAKPGDSLRVQAQDWNDCYSLEALWLHKADGSSKTQLTGDIFGPNCGSEPQGQIFFDKTFTLP
jgi:hypothetical protein